MIDPNSMVIWWGKLDAPGLNTTVVYDPSLPGMPTGQIYLYNAVRNSIIPYDWNIVRRYLKDVDPSELRLMQRTLGHKWQTVREEFVKASNRPVVNWDSK
jgi:hypothetical protein